jgi:aminomethyltransferase
MLREDSPFTIGLDRLVDTSQSIEFIGKAALKKIEEEGTKRKLVGVVIDGDPIKTPPEQFWPVKDNNVKIGHISRCIFSPRLNKNIGFANVPVELSHIDTTFSVVTPDGQKEATVCKWPWFPAERINKKT